MRQEDCKFKASLSYTDCLKKLTKRNMAQVAKFLSSNPSLGGGGIKTKKKYALITHKSELSLAL
jgi:hypothetical protein